MRDTKADIVVIGEYELSVGRLIRSIAENQDRELVPNLVIRTTDNTIRHTDLDFDALHPHLADDLLPAYHHMRPEAYYGDCYVNNRPVKKRNWGVIQGSRGCPFSCTFCFNFWGRKVRKRHPEAIVAEMAFLERRIGFGELFFIDFTFTLDRLWVLSLCELIQEKGLRIGWTVETRCDLIDEEMVQAMAQANCRRIWLGIESFDSGILRDTDKYQSAEEIPPAVDAIRRAGIEPSAFIMLGLPGETQDTINATIRGVHGLKLAYTQSIIISTPRFGTSYYALAQKQHRHLGSYWQDLDAVKGLVANDMRPHLLQRAINLMKDRQFIYRDDCPRM